MRCILIDDEESSISILRRLLEMFCQDVTVEAVTTSQVEARQLIRKVRPDLIFLDIEMPDGNAFEMLRQLQPVDFEIIFVSGFSQYAIDGFRFSALDFLLKPVDIEDLRKSIDKARRKLADKSINERLNHFLSLLPAAPQHQFAIPTGEGLVFVKVEDIISCSAEGSYTSFAFNDKKTLLASGMLKEYEEQLPPSLFCRVHHSHLINVDHIKKYYKGKGGYVEMSNGKTIEVSQRKKDEFLSRFRKRD
jgi:two-component system, LytTR family, response regulator